MADRFCSYCGTALVQGAGFCPGCGTPVRRTPAPPLPSSAGPVMQATTQILLGGDNQRVTVYEDRVEVKTVGALVVTSSVQEVRFGQLAGLRVDRGLLTATLFLETRGGDALRVKGLSKADA